MIAKLIQVIETVERRGCGHSELRPCDEGRFEVLHRHEPVRIVTQYFDLKGSLLAERDPLSEVVGR